MSIIILIQVVANGIMMQEHNYTLKDMPILENEFILTASCVCYRYKRNAIFGFAEDVEQK